MALRGRPNKENSKKVDNRPSRTKPPVIITSTVIKIPKPEIKLSPKGVNEYNRLYRNAIENGLISEIDFASIQSAAKFYDVHIQLEDAMSSIDDRFSDTASGGKMLSMQSIESIRMFEKYFKIALQFGVTPLARMRITAKPTEKKSDEQRFEESYGS